MNHILRATILTALAILVGCGGGGGGTPTGGGVTPPPQPTSPPPPTLGTFAFHIIGVGTATRAIGMAPAGSTPVLPTGFQVGTPVAGAIVIYPDGSTQQADANGVFLPGSSSYALKYPTTVQTSAFAQPFVKVGDPAGGSSLGSANVSPYASGSSTRLGGIALLPSGAQLFSGETLTLVATATDVDDRVASLGGASLQWSSALGATITPIPGTNQATYVAPALAGGTENDTVTVSASVSGISASYSATAFVTTFAPSAGFSVSGSLTNGSSSVPGGGAIFVEQDSPRVFPSFNFFAAADASGSYARLLPPNISLLLALSLPSASVPGAVAAIVPATLAPSGDTSFDTGAAGANAVANLTAAASTNGFDDSKDDAKNAIPDPIVTVRDAWFAHQLTRAYPFWADSGVLGLLASPSGSTSSPHTIGSGLFAQWCYQWQTSNGANVLVLIENAAATCTAAGNDAFVIAPQTASGTFDFSEYRAASGGYSLSGMLQPTTGAQLVAAGSWQQTLAYSGSAIANETAAVQIAFYGPVSQTLSGPVSQLSEQYTYALSGGTASAQVTSALLRDPLSSLTLANATVTLTPAAPASSCVGTPSACYQSTASITRTYNVAGATATHAYATQDTQNGDGSGLDVITSTEQSDSSGVRIPIAATTTRTAGSCVICGAAGELVDGDGTTQLGSFGVDAMQRVAFTLLDSVEGSGAGSPVAQLAFVL